MLLFVFPGVIKIFIVTRVWSGTLFRSPNRYLFVLLLTKLKYEMPSRIALRADRNDASLFSA